MTRAHGRRNGGAAMVLPGDGAEKHITQIERLAQFWKAGLLSDDEIQEAVSALLGSAVPVKVLLWDYDCEGMNLPLD